MKALGNPNGYIDYYNGPVAVASGPMGYSPALKETGEFSTGYAGPGGFHKGWPQQSQTAAMSTPEPGFGEYSRQTPGRQANANYSYYNAAPDMAYGASMGFGTVNSGMPDFGIRPGYDGQGAMGYGMDGSPMARGLNKYGIQEGGAHIPVGRFPTQYQTPYETPNTIGSVKYANSGQPGGSQPIGWASGQPKIQAAQPNYGKPPLQGGNLSQIISRLLTGMPSQPLTSKAALRHIQKHFKLNRSDAALLQSVMKGAGTMNAQGGYQPGIFGYYPGSNMIGS